MTQPIQPLISDGDMAKIAVVLVTYQPDLELLTESLLAIAPQVNYLILVDNNSSNIGEFNIEYLKSIGDVKFELIKLNQNTGLGCGFNKGIKRACDQGFSFVLLMDQDSIPQPNMVHQLYQNLVSLQSSGLQVAAAGPRFCDSNGQNTSHFSRYCFFGKRLIKCKEDTNRVLVDTLISSGTLISSRAVEQLGLMDETLFIDHVDTEWCLRAKAAGWSVYGVCHAFMQHSLGDKRQKIWFLRWRYVSYHSPFRYYYMFRNSVLLMRRPYISLAWKWFCFIQLSMLFGYFVFLAPNRRLNLRMMQRGLMDGWRGFSGKLKNDTDN